MRYKAQNKDYKATDHGQAAFIGYHPASTSIEIPEHFLSRSKTFQFPSGKLLFGDFVSVISLSFIVYILILSSV